MSQIKFYRNHLSRLSKKMLAIYAAVAVITITALWGILFVSNALFAPNTGQNIAKNYDLYLPKNATFAELIWILERDNAIKNLSTFKFVAKLRELDKNIKPGKYRIVSGMNNRTITGILAGGMQTPVRLIFNNLRTKEQLSAVLSKQLMADSVSILNVLNDTAYLKTKGFDTYTAICPFLPNTYEVYWDISPKRLYERMIKEYNKFWTNERKQQAEKLQLKQNEVITLASIVDEETNIKSEKPVIAGLYMNRLNRGMPLQACPTLKFALGNFTIQRILKAYELTPSPYNTYQNTGLPPGPIRIPSAETIDAVLNATPSDYLYMCAKEDFSGSHYFSSSLAQHNAYANRYHHALNRRKIFQ